MVLLPVVVLQFHHARGRKFGPIPDYAARGRGTRDKPVRVAIVGGGASGIAAAWHLRHSREALFLQSREVLFLLSRETLLFFSRAARSFRIPWEMCCRPHG